MPSAAKKTTSDVHKTILVRDRAFLKRLLVENRTATMTGIASCAVAEPSEPEIFWVALISFAKASHMLSNTRRVVPTKRTGPGLIGADGDKTCGGISIVFLPNDSDHPRGGQCRSAKRTFARVALWRLVRLAFHRRAECIRIDPRICSKTTLFCCSSETGPLTDEITVACSKNRK